MPNLFKYYLMNYAKAIMKISANARPTKGCRRVTTLVSQKVLFSDPLQLRQ